MPNVDNPKEFRCISLCTGYAGLELGLRRVIPALRTVCYVEVEAFACTNLVAKIEKGELDAAPIWTDIKTFDGRPFHKRVHIITAGYPCQPFSVAGKRKGTDDPRHLWPHIERIVQAVRPVWCFFENVSGHLSIGFPEVYRSLRLMGYKVEARLFTAAEVGAPHKRERLFILAYSECPEPGKGVIEETPTRIRRNRPAISGTSELANIGTTEFQGRQGQQRDNGTELQAIAGSCNQWPSRPGQPQYEWEEPRVVAESTGQGLQRGIRKPGEPSKSPRQAQGEGGEQTNRPFGQGNVDNKGQAQSRLGRAANGTKSRVDRLRLLGNGVVPQQAEKAFRELIKLF